jgi:AraC-like DNA-binding protein/tetratricopeptide (TPR) repeat protein
MAAQPMPRHLRKALERLEADPARVWTVRGLASECGVGPRTLQRQFRRFIGQTPMEYLRDLRLDRARGEVFRASGGGTVTDIAVRCGFNHLGRFAARYREHFGETPHATLRRRQNALARGRSHLAPLPVAVERPTIAVLPFDLVGPDAHHAADLAEETIAALMRMRWIVVTEPARARYHLRGKVRGDGVGRLRVAAILVDRSAGRYLWADHWKGDANDLLGFEEQVAARVAMAVQPSIREAETDRAWRTDPARLNAWGLTMRALRCALLVEPAAESMALELLEQAIELASCDPLPLALAAWCHGLRGGHNFCVQPDREKAAAYTLAGRAAQLSNGDPLTDTFVAAGYTLAHDLTTAAIHADRALALDGGSAWAWGRCGLIKLYRGEEAEAIEYLQVARALAPADRLNFLWSVGVAAGHFEAARYEQAVRWFERALAENPGAIWVNYVLAPAYELAGRKEHAQRSFANFARVFPEVTIAQVRSGLPYRDSFLDRIAEGLGSLGMRHC